MNKNGELLNKISVLRAEMKWSQQELADRVGVSRQTISSVEANRYNPSLVLAFEIAYSFGKNIQDVFQYKL